MFTWPSTMCLFTWCYKANAHIPSDLYQVSRQQTVIFHSDTSWRHISCYMNQISEFSCVGCSLLPLNQPIAPGIPLMLSCWEAIICLQLLFGFTCLVGWLVYDKRGIVSKLWNRMEKVYSDFHLRSPQRDSVDSGRVNVCWRREVCINFSSQDCDIENVLVFFYAELNTDRQAGVHVFPLWNKEIVCIWPEFRIVRGHINHKVHVNSL